MMYKYSLIDHISGETFNFKNKTQFHNFTVDRLLDYGRNKDNFVRLYEITSFCYMITRQDN